MAAHPFQIAEGRFAKEALVLTIELGRAFVAYSQPRAARIHLAGQHQTLGLVQAQPLVILQRAHARDLLEMPVEGRCAHVDLAGQLAHQQGFAVVLAEPVRSLGDAVGLGAVGIELTQPGALRPDEQQVVDLPDDQRRKDGDPFRRIQQAGQTQEGIQQFGAGRAQDDAAVRAGRRRPVP